MTAERSSTATISPLPAEKCELILFFRSKRHCFPFSPIDIDGATPLTDSGANQPFRMSPVPILVDLRLLTGCTTRRREVGAH
ncbi:MAG: hypothetical protein V3U24_00505 [Candidatus Neomarinimicrobiota bacterium]